MNEEKMQKKILIFGIVLCLISGLMGSAISAPASTVAKVQMYNNSPTLFINGKPYLGWISILPYPRPRIIESFAKEGIHVYHARGNFFRPPEETEKTLMEIIKNDPEAYLLVGTDLSANWRKGQGMEWLVEHPKEKQIGMRLNGSRTRWTQSMASEVWHEDATNMLTNYIAYLENSPVGKHIIGYHVTQYEGVYKGSFFDRMPDYSEPMTKAFRKWIQAKYDNNIESLRKAWKKKNLTFETVNIPSAGRRMGGELSFRNPLEHQQLVDYDMFASDLMAEYQIYFAKLTKELTNGNKLVGMYGGYVTGTTSSGLNWKNEGVKKYYQNLGSFAFNKLADSPYIDYTASPQNYNYRGAGEGISIIPPTGTWRFHKKLSIWEDDTRTAIMALFDQPGSCATVEETVEVFKRNFGYNLTSGSLSWVPATYFGYNNCEHPDIMAALGKCQEIAAQAQSFARNPNSEVAVFVDEESYLYMRILSQVTPPMIDELLHNDLLKAGFPFDVYLLSDLKEKDFPEYKFYIFTNVFHVDDETEKAIKAKLTASVSTALWFYAPGYATDSGFSAENVSKLTGIRVGVENRMGRSNIKITDNDDLITKGMKDKIITFATDVSEKPYGPLFYVNDPEATVIGDIVETHKPGFAYKKIGNVTSIYSAAPGMTWPFLRNIARMSGVHVYADTGDIIYSSKNFLVIHAASTGEKIISIPEENDVYDIYEETLVAKGVKSFKIKMKKGTTRLFFVGDVKVWKPGKKAALIEKNTDELIWDNMHFKDVEKEKCFPVSLEDHVNRLWFKDKTKNLPAALPIGKHILSNVPFDILNPKENNDKFCIMLRGGSMPHFPQEVTGIPVQRKVKNLYFLHTSAWMQAETSTVMEYIIHYADKSMVKIPIKAHYEITDGVNGGNFSFCGMANPDAKVACVYKRSSRYPTCGLYSFRWKNPNPDKLVSSIDVSTSVNTGEAVPAIIAITGEA
jgi:hypothetical protein